MKRTIGMLFTFPALLLLIAAINESRNLNDAHSRSGAEDNAKAMIDEGRHTFRFDTFGDETFWTGALHMQQAVSTLSPQAALGLGLKVDAQALSPSAIEEIKHGRINLGDPAVTLALIKQNATTATAGTSVTMATTSPTSGARITHLYFEVVHLELEQIAQLTAFRGTALP